MDSWHKHPFRKKVRELEQRLDKLRQQQTTLLKQIAEAEREARENCKTECPSGNEKWTRDNYPYAELYCRHCGTFKR